jgi:hypothetical protein
MRADRLTLHDANMATLTGGVVVGPFDATPSVEDVQRALVEIGRLNPTARAFCNLEVTRTGGRWVPLPARERDERCRSMVSALAVEVPGDVDDWIDRLVQPFPPGRLLHFSVGDPYVMVWFAHVLGDNDFAWFAPAVLRTALGAPAQVHPQVMGSRAPLSRALVEQFGRHPRRLAAAWRQSRVAAPAGRRSVAEPPALRALASSADRSVTSALREWRRERCPDASMNAVLMVAVRGALEEAGLEFGSDGYRVLVDGRRYLPKGVRVAGNFATAIYAAPTDPVSPGEIDSVLRANLDSGRPLATMAVSAAKQLLGGGRRSTAAPTGPERPTLTVSNIGRMRDWELVPGLDPDRCAYVCASTPDPFGITVFVATMLERLTFTAAFGATAADPVLVAAALERLSGDPVAVLDRVFGARPAAAGSR